jgi:protein TonB
MKKLLSICVAAIAVVFGSPASSKRNDIIVSGTPSRVQWVTKLGRMLDETILYPMEMPGRDPSSGIVSVSFKPGGDGKPSSPTVTRSSRHQELDQAALQAVKRLKSMYPLPVGIAHDQRILANIIFATSASELSQQIYNFRHEAARAKTRSALDRDTIVLNSFPTNAGGRSGAAR